MSKQTPEIVINMDKKCVECGHGGATASGLCLLCASQVMRGVPMRSNKGKVIAKEILQRLRK